MKRIFLLMLILLIVPNWCLAKYIYDDTGNICFETSNQWHLSSFGEDPLTYELISISYDRDTFIKLSQSKYKMKYKNFNQATDSEVSELQDSIIRFYIDLFKSKGCTFSINKTDYHNNRITVGASIKKDNWTIGKIIIITYIKNYVGYSLIGTCTDKSSHEFVKTLSSLKINGEKIDAWMK